MSNVGDLRRQTAIADSNVPVILACKDPSVRALLDSLEIVNVYPDQSDDHGNFTSTFKIEVRKK